MSDNITVTGNIATDPDHKRTSAGVAITSFRLASSQRRFDRATGVWIDGATNFYSVSTFRGLAEHAFASLKKGDRVLLTGRLRLRDWEAGAKRGTTVEIDAEAIGHDLLWGTTTFHRSSPTGAPRTTGDESDVWHAGSESTPTVGDHVPDAWNLPGGDSSHAFGADEDHSGEALGEQEQRALLPTAGDTPF